MISRIGKFITILSLSLMIIVMSVGVSVEHCSHTGRLQLVSMTAAGHHSEGCVPHTSCMSVQVLHLSPTSTVQTADPILRPAWHLLSDFSSLPALLPQPSMVERIAEAWHHAHHPTPRHYLSLLCTLVI